MGLQPTGPTRVTWKSLTGLIPEKWKQTATLCPLDWTSNYSLLRLWHTTKSFHQYAAQLKQLGVWWCSVVLTSFCLMAAKAFGPVWGLFYPLHHGACVVGVLCTPTLRNSSPDDLDPLWDTARSLSAPVVVVSWFFGCWCLPSLCTLPCLHFGVRRLDCCKSFLFSLVCLRCLWMLVEWQGKSSAH